MILHTVCFTFKEGISWESDKALAAEKLTHLHPNHINEIKGWFCGRNISARINSFDFLLLSVFESQNDLQSFIEHPTHQEAVEVWKQIADWEISDVDLNSKDEIYNGLKSLIPFV